MKARVIRSDGEKAALIERLSGQRVPLMLFYEDAPPASMRHEVVGEAWLIHPPYEYEQLEKWLYLGN